MAFGLKPKNETTGSKNRFYATKVMQLDGVRRFMLLSNLNGDDDEPVEIPVKSYGLWLPVRVGENTAKRRVFIDFQTKEEVLPENLRRGCLSRIFMNVWDVSPVIELDTNPENADEVVLAYTDESGKFTTGYGDNKKIHQGKGSPNNRIMVLEASPSLLGNIVGQLGIVYNMNGEPVESLLEMQFTARMIADASDPKKKIATASGMHVPDMNRSFDDLPRYDTTTFKPWPKDAIRALIEGEEFDAVVNTYQIKYNLVKDEDVF